MIPRARSLAMAVWAAREVQRHPGRSFLLFACLTSLVLIIAIPLLFSHALTLTWTRLMDHTPDLVVRRIDAGGWAPLPADEAVLHAGQVPGALDATPRIWGIATGPDGPVTVVASAAALPDGALNGLRPPAVGEAVVGRAVAEASVDRRLHLRRRDGITLEMIGSFPADSGLVTHDLVWVAPEDAQRLFGLMPGQASDLAVYLFREEGAEAVAADLAEAFPWPVNIIHRDTALLHRRSRAMGAGGVALLVSVPALLALLWVVAGTALGPSGRQAYWGLLQSMGWTTGDLVRLQVNKALLVGLPAVGLGMALAYAAVFHPPAAAFVARWISGTRHLPALALDGGGAIVILLEIAAVVGLPFLATVFLTTVRGVEGAARATLQAGQWH